MSSKPTLTIFYQFNPWRSSIGGIQTIVRSFLKYAPSEFEVRMVGTGNSQEKLNVWQDREYGDKPIKFMPLIALKDDNTRKAVPTTVKYTTALLNRNLASDFMHFHRLEPSMTTLKWRGDKSFFLHNDIQQQMNSKDAKNGILWKYFPAGYFALENSLIKQFNHIYSCNTQATEFYQQRYPQLAKNITYLKNAVDTEIFSTLHCEEREEKRRILAARLGLASETRFILFAGRLHPQKDPLLLIRSFAELQEPNVHLLIAGDGELAQSTKAEIERCGLSERVTMLGAVVQEELAKLYPIASIFVLSSVYEGLPVSVLEALACGTPIVTTNCGETPNLLTSNSGIVVIERTSQAIASGLSQVLQNPQAYPSNSCTKIAEPYSAKTVIGNVYQHMLARWEQKQALSSDRTA